MGSVVGVVLGVVFAGLLVTLGMDKYRKKRGKKNTAQSEMTSSYRSSTAEII
jgi:hypothetical protein